MEKLFKGKWLTTLVVLLLGCCALSSCSDDKDDEPKNVSIVGTWRWDFDDGYELWTFEKNGKMSLVEIDHVSGDWSDSGQYDVSGNILILKWADGETYTLKIHTLTQKTLILLYPEEDDEDYEEIWTRVK